ncbi:hypothetical protein ERJ75_000229900 [Trypanosoma vivax]|nr:hypothetical protein ERJ75_000229900 [Trypanosoma vivax]
MVVKELKREADNRHRFATLRKGSGTRDRLGGGQANARGMAQKTVVSGARTGTRNKGSATRARKSRRGAKEKASPRTEKTGCEGREKDSAPRGHAARLQQLASLCVRLAQSGRQDARDVAG